MSQTATSPKAVPIGVGLDTARYGHHVSFLREDRQHAAKPFSFTESHEGYQKLRQALQAIEQRHGSVHFHIRIDAAGQYATNLERFVRSLPFPKTLSIGEPKRNKDYRKAHFPKRKADPVESLACARFAIVERPAATPEVPTEFYQLRETLSALHSQVKHSARLKNQLHNRLARTFPELPVLVSDLSARWVLMLLENYPTAEKIATAPLSSLTKIPYLTKDKAEEIRAAAKRTTATLCGVIIEQTIEQLVLQLRQSIQVEKKLEKLLEKAYDALPASNHVHIQSIKGIAKKTAAALVGKIVSIDRFQTPGHVVGYFGIFPEENSSGLDKYGKSVPPGTMRMSQKGNDLVRGYLWMATKSGLRGNPAIRALYARQVANGKRGDVAFGHCMRKLLHLVFAVWKSGKPFDPNHYPWHQVQPQQTQGRNEKAVGRNKGQHPERQAVTTAASKVDGPTAAVKHAAAEKAANASSAATPRNGSLDFALIRQQASMEQVLGHLGVLEHLRGSGLQRRGPCPLHAATDGKTRTFSVHLQKKVFQCFHPACGASGNVLDLWASVHELPLYEAALHLAGTFRLQTKQVAEKKATRKRNP